MSAESDVDPGRRLDEIADLLDRLPPDDPAVVQSLDDATRLLLALGINRSALANQRVAASYEQLAERWPADHPMTTYVVFMSRSVRFMQAVFAGDTERADITLSEMVRSASLVPADHPLLPLVLCWVATAYIERHSLSGDLRNLDLALDAINRALTAATQIGGLFAPGSPTHGILLYVRGHASTVWSVYDPQVSRIVTAIEDLEQALAQVGPELAVHADLTSVLNTARVMLRAAHRAVQARPAAGREDEHGVRAAT